MSSIEELERRLAAVEQEVVALREQTTDTHTLAAHADREVAEFRSELRAQTRLLNLTRLDMTEQGQRLERLESEVRGGFAEVKVGMEQIVSMLGALGGQGEQS